MSIWKSVKDKLVVDRLFDEHIYGEAIREIESGVRRDGLWAKAILQSGADETRAKATYIRLLVQRMKDEHYLAGRMAEHANSESREDSAKLTPNDPRRGTATDEPLIDPACRTPYGSLADLAFIHKHREYLFGLCDKISRKNLRFNEYADLALAVGATYSSDGYFAKAYRVQFGSLNGEFDQAEEVRQWFMKYVVPEILSRA